MTLSLAALVWMDEVGEEWFESPDEKFCYRFVQGVAQPNWSELVNRFWFDHFGDEADGG